MVAGGVIGFSSISYQMRIVILEMRDFSMNVILINGKRQ